jgi:phosphoribosyl-ATP pyrophosphohydrolase
MSEPSVLSSLAATIADRKANPPAKGSYVVKLLEGGTSKIGAKVLEEAAEVVEAAAEPGPDGQVHLVREVADLVFHTLVLLEHREVTWADVEAELARRFGTSGLEEKAARGQANRSEVESKDKE